MFNRISVWLDDYAPDEGAFAHASDWAARLRVPLHGVAASVLPHGTDPLSARTLRACDIACTRKGVDWEPELVLNSSGCVAWFFREAELSAFSATLPGAERERLLGESFRNTKASVMVCPAAWRPASRTLVLHHGAGPGVQFLRRVVPLCRSLATPPVVLTVARSERRAEDRQDLAREVFYDAGLDADFDLVAGCDVPTAVGHAARARGCSHVILERENVPPWWRWLHGDTARRLFGIADRLTLVALPGGDDEGGPAVPGGGRN